MGGVEALGPLGPLVMGSPAASSGLIRSRADAVPTTSRCPQATRTTRPTTSAATILAGDGVLDELATATLLLSEVGPRREAVPTRLGGTGDLPGQQATFPGRRPLSVSRFSPPSGTVRHRRRAVRDRRPSPAEGRDAAGEPEGPSGSVGGGQPDDTAGGQPRHDRHRPRRATGCPARRAGPGRGPSAGSGRTRLAPPSTRRGTAGAFGARDGGGWRRPTPQGASAAPHRKEIHWVLPVTGCWVTRARRFGATGWGRARSLLDNGHGASRAPVGQGRGLPRAPRLVNRVRLTP